MLRDTTTYTTTYTTTTIDDDIICFAAGTLEGIKITFHPHLSKNLKVLHQALNATYEMDLFDSELIYLRKWCLKDKVEESGIDGNVDSSEYDNSDGEKSLEF